MRCRCNERPVVIFFNSTTAFSRPEPASSPFCRFPALPTPFASSEKIFRHFTGVSPVSMTAESSYISRHFRASGRQSRYFNRALSAFQTHMSWHPQVTSFLYRLSSTPPVPPAGETPFSSTVTPAGVTALPCPLAPVGDDVKLRHPHLNSSYICHTTDDVG